MSLAAKHEKATKKKDKKNAIKNEAVKLLKKGKSAQKVDEPPAGAPPLPPPALPPPADEPAAANEVPSGKFRIISEFAGPMLFGRQGPAMGAGETQIQLHLESDPRNSFERVAWVDRAWVMSIDESIKPSWVFPRLSLGRQAKQHILLQSGTCHEDVDEMDLPWDDVELVPKEMGAEGLDGQHIIYGGLVLCYMALGKKLDEIQGISMLSPALVCSLAADNPADNEFVSHELLCKCLKKKMAGKDDAFLCPLASGGPWGWWISMRVRSGTMIPCVAQMIAKRLALRRKSATFQRKLWQWQKDCWASCNHWAASVKACFTAQLCIGRIRNQDSHMVATYVANIFWHMLNRR